MKTDKKTNYVEPQAVPMQLELEQCIAQSATLNAFEDNVLFNEIF
jgi:hypothetical protein